MSNPRVKRQKKADEPTLITPSSFLASKFGLVNWFGFIGTTASASLLPPFVLLLAETFVARGPRHPSPHPDSCTVGIFSSTGVGESGAWRGWDGILHQRPHPGPNPSRPGPNKKKKQPMCARGRTIQLNPTRCVLRSYLGKAKYILSYQRRRMSDWNSQFYPRRPLPRPDTSPPAQTQTHPLRLATFKLYKWKNWDGKEGENNQTARNKRALNVTRVGRWVVHS